LLLGYALRAALVAVASRFITERDLT